MEHDSIKTTCDGAAANESETQIVFIILIRYCKIWDYHGG
jgi:hypothetical protein